MDRPYCLAGPGHHRDGLQVLERDVTILCLCFMMLKVPFVPCIVPVFTNALVTIEATESI